MIAFPIVKVYWPDRVRRSGKHHPAFGSSYGKVGAVGWSIGDRRERTLLSRYETKLGE